MKYRSTDPFRPGTRVLVKAPQGSMFDGRVGTIDAIHDQTLMLRLDGMREIALPFDRSEVVGYSSVLRETHR